MAIDTDVRKSVFTDAEIKAFKDSFSRALTEKLNEFADTFRGVYEKPDQFKETFERVLRDELDEFEGAFTDVFKHDRYIRCYGNKEHQPIVFLHGGPGANSFAFEKSTAQKLADLKYYVILYDQRGCGRSDEHRKEGKKNLSLPRAIADLREVIATQCANLKHPKPILIGHSWGGFLSLKFLRDHCDEVKGLVMVCSPINYPECYHTLLEGAYNVYDKLLSLMDMKNFPIKKEIKRLQNAMFPDGFDPASDRTYKFEARHIEEVFKYAKTTMLDQAPLTVLLLNSGSRQMIKDLSSQYESFWLTRFREEVGANYYWNSQCHRGTCFLESRNRDLLEEVSSKIPVHAIYSEDDRFFSKRQLKVIKEALPPSHFSYIYGAGHYPFLDQNRQFIEVLCKHLTRMRAQR